MQLLHKALQEELGELPGDIFAQLLSEKLNARGLKLSRREIQLLQKRILSGESRTLHLRRWRWWERQCIDLEFTDHEMQEFEHRLTRDISEMLPQVIDTMAGELATCILATLKRNWCRELQRPSRERASFQRRLFRRWGVSLGLLRMLVTISREYGASMNQELRESAAAQSPHLVESLTRLHARACQVVEEILVLLTAGFADGAMARWRTLHEIAVIALFIGEHGEELAERYVLHQYVESRRAAQDYVACQKRLGYEALDPGKVASVERSYEAVVARFGRAFGTQYGWAAQQLGIDKPLFTDIERAAGIEHFRAQYRMASHNVHANPKGVFFKLGLLKEKNLLLAGPSNAGLADPGHGAAISLVQTSTPLALLHPTLDNIVILRIMVELERETGQAFGDAHQRLVNDAA
ncbi:MAG: hypothetical protein A3G20_01880 [Acidobacteria bacterium RIFCSPLOWO2_12_FULL_59_11]|nr:MAG: hypothetical protein A3G20_01880 [Acidobacteria bacterium RIFCSPLOWO2_12_FULL_59_11]